MARLGNTVTVSQAFGPGRLIVGPDWIFENVGIKEGIDRIANIYLGKTNTAETRERFRQELQSYLYKLELEAEAYRMTLAQYITKLNEEHKMSNLNHNELLNSFIEVELADDEAFLKIKESLTRIGIANMKRDKLTQTAHIFQKRGQYYIVNFLEMFALDGKETTFTDEDKTRVWVVAQLLEAWGLLKILSPIPESAKGLKPVQVSLTIIDYKSKPKWELISKYTIGVKK